MSHNFLGKNQFLRIISENGKILSILKLAKYIYIFVLYIFIISEK